MGAEGGRERTVPLVAVGRFCEAAAADGAPEERNSSSSKSPKRARAYVVRPAAVALSKPSSSCFSRRSANPTVPVAKPTMVTNALMSAMIS